MAKKADDPHMGWEDIIRRDPREKEASLGAAKRETLNRLGWRMSVQSCGGFRQLGAAVS